MNSSQATQSNTYGFGTKLDLPFDEAVDRTKEALKAEGFGVLTSIDIQSTLREKLGVDFERYVILGACNPGLAHRALTVEHEIGLLLPCNVVIHEHGGACMVAIADPAKMLGIVGDNAELQAIADEATQRLRRVVAALQAGA
jgi:uncharacterized protein (DUF302 family)